MIDAFLMDSVCGYLRPFNFKDNTWASPLSQQLESEIKLRLKAAFDGMEAPQKQQYPGFETAMPLEVTHQLKNKFTNTRYNANKIAKVLAAGHGRCEISCIDHAATRD